jgi:hypothetical protein
MPISRPFSTTGRQPTSRSRIMQAAVANEASAPITETSRFITSLTSTVLS